MPIFGGDNNTNAIDGGDNGAGNKQDVNCSFDFDKYLYLIDYVFFFVSVGFWFIY